MTLMSFIMVGVFVGLLMYFINEFIPMDASVKKILNVAVIVLFVLWLIQALGLLGPIGNIRLR